jgi:hypothetical protein
MFSSMDNDPEPSAIVIDPNQLAHIKALCTSILLDLDLLAEILGLDEYCLSRPSPVKALPSS